MRLHMRIQMDGIYSTSMLLLQFKSNFGECKAYLCHWTFSFQNCVYGCAQDQPNDIFMYLRPTCGHKSRFAYKKDLPDLCTNIQKISYILTAGDNKGKVVLNSESIFNLIPSSKKCAKIRCLSTFRTKVKSWVDSSEYISLIFLRMGPNWKYFPRLSHL